MGQGDIIGERFTVRGWRGLLTLEPSVVYEAWCSQRPGDIIVMIEEIHGKPVKAGDSFSAAHIVGYFDTIEEMHSVYDRHKGHTALTADTSSWQLVKCCPVKEQSYQTIFRSQRSRRFQNAAVRAGNGGLLFCGSVLPITFLPRRVD